jgi:lysozyme
MERSEFVAQIKRHEAYRDRIYPDSVGVPTVGWGHALLTGSSFPQAASEILLEADLAQVDRDYEKLNLPIAADDMVRQYAIKNMLFNLGLSKLSGFVNFLAAVRRHDWEAAKMHGLDSKWARQVGPRAQELMQMIATGMYQG